MTSYKHVDKTTMGWVRIQWTSEDNYLHRVDGCAWSVEDYNDTTDTLLYIWCINGYMLNNNEAIEEFLLLHEMTVPLDEDEQLLFWLKFNDSNYLSDTRYSLQK